MAKRTSRLLSVLLVLCMVLALLSAAAFAADGDTIEFYLKYYPEDMKEPTVSANGAAITPYKTDENPSGVDRGLYYKVAKNVKVVVNCTFTDSAKMPVPGLIYDTDPFTSLGDMYPEKEGISVSKRTDGTYDVTIQLYEDRFGKVTEGSPNDWLLEEQANGNIWGENGIYTGDIYVVGAYLNIIPGDAEAEPSGVTIDGLGFKADKTAAAREIAALGGTAGDVKDNTMYFRLDGLDASKTYTAKVTMVTDNIIAEGVYDDIPRDVHSESVSGAASKVLAFNIDDNWLVGGRYTLSVYEGGAATGTPVSTKELILWDVGFDVENGTMKGTEPGYLYEALAMGTKNGVTEDISSIAPEVTPDAGYRLGEWKKSGDIFSTTYFTVYQMTCVEGSAPVAVLSPQRLTVNGEEKKCEKYNIKDENYFKLRDLAYMLNGTGSQFEVVYDDATRTVTITTGAAYTPTGKELGEVVDKSASAVVSTQEIYVNGEKIALTVYNIGDNNFFRLRDLGPVLGFEVDYDQGTNTAIVRSK